MSCLRTTTVETPEEKHNRIQQRIDQQHLQLQKLVCEHGPRLLTLAMPLEEANQAMIDCIEHLVKRITQFESNHTAQLEALGNENKRLRACLCGGCQERLGFRLIHQEPQ